MSQANSISIHGNLTHDPIIKEHNGRSFCSFQIASTRRWKRDGEDEEQSHTDFIPVTAWGKIASSITEQEISKGTLIAVEGGLRSSHYEKDGEARSRVFVSARSITNILREKNETKDAPTTCVIPPIEVFDPADLPF